MKFEDLRMLLVQDLVKENITHERVLEAISNVPREFFIPEDLQRYAYQNSAINIGEGQTISQPLIIAKMLQLVDIKPTDRVLEIGTGSGYQTAIISQLTQHVFTVERIDVLSRKARKILKQLQYGNINFRVGDGTRGWEKAYPPCKEFDKIIVCAGSPSIPEMLIEQLALNGKLVIPTGNREGQSLVVITKTENGIAKQVLDTCSFVPLIGEQGWEK